MPISRFDLRVVSLYFNQHRYQPWPTDISEISELFRTSLGNFRFMSRTPAIFASSSNMCLERDGGLTHSCVPECQACYAFTLDNLQLLAAEESASLNLGSLVDLVPIAEKGCTFCKFLLQVAIMSGKVGVAAVQSSRSNLTLSTAMGRRRIRRDQACGIV